VLSLLKGLRSRLWKKCSEYKINISLTHILKQKDLRKEVSLKYKIEAEDKGKKNRGLEGNPHSSVYLIYERIKER
jgi:hypothetical protein